MREVTIPVTFTIGTPDEPGLESVGPVSPSWVVQRGPRNDDGTRDYYALKADLHSPLVDALLNIRGGEALPSLVARMDVRPLASAIFRELEAEAMEREVNGT